MGQNVNPQKQNLGRFDTGERCRTLSAKFHHGNDLHPHRTTYTIDCPRLPDGYDQTARAPCLPIRIPFEAFCYLETTSLSPWQKYSTVTLNVNNLKKTFFKVFFVDFLTLGGGPGGR